MKKVYLNCVFKKNLGDDLLIKILCDRYQKTDFYLPNYRYGKIIPKLKNLHTIYIPKIIFRIFRKIGYITKTFNIIEKIILCRCNYIISIAGSLFMENKKSDYDDKIDWFKKLNKNFYLIGSNIGPVYTDKYITKIKKEVLSKAKDVCLRDKKSYNYVKDSNIVRYAPDIVFSLDVTKYLDQKCSKKAIISVIDINSKKGQIVTPNKEKYLKTINVLINKLFNFGYEVELFSFCKEENDEQAIREILEKNNNSNLIKTYYYNGNIDEALKELATAEVIIGTRFHANVLGFILNKSVLPIIYNDKTRELLQDMNYKGKIIDIEKIDEFNIDEFTEKDLEYKINVNEYIKKANEHFIKIDKELK